MQAIYLFLSLPRRPSIANGWEWLKPRRHQMNRSFVQSLLFLCTNEYKFWNNWTSFNAIRVRLTENGPTLVGFKKMADTTTAKKLFSLESNYTNWQQQIYTQTYHHKIAYETMFSASAQCLNIQRSTSKRKTNRKKIYIVCRANGIISDDW